MVWDQIEQVMIIAYVVHLVRFHSYYELVRMSIVEVLVDHCMSRNSHQCHRIFPGLLEFGLMIYSCIAVAAVVGLHRRHHRTSRRNMLLLLQELEGVVETAAVAPIWGHRVNMRVN